MGADVEIYLVEGDPALHEALRVRLGELERRWSRFLPDSDVSRLNGAGGRPVAVHPDTADVLQRAVFAWRATDGAFDPTVLPALLGAGYDRTFHDLGDDPRPATAVPAAGGDAVEVHPDRDEARLARGARIDLGGIGKGYAADLLTDAALAGGAAGCCVSLGGDLRVAGAGPDGDGDGWLVTVEDPFAPPARLARLGLTEGAVVTTSRVRRSWSRAGERQHHLVDPAVGAPAWTGLAAVTVVGGEAWWAEVVAKAAYLAGPSGASAVLDRAGVTGVLVDDDGRAHPEPGWEAYLR